MHHAILQFVFFLCSWKLHKSLCQTEPCILCLSDEMICIKNRLEKGLSYKQMTLKNELRGKLLIIHLNLYFVNVSKPSSQLASFFKWYHNIFKGWHFFTVEDIYFYSYVPHLPVWSGLRSEVALIRHLCVRTYQRAVFVCEINQLQVQQMLAQTGSGRHLCFTWVRPKRWHWKWTARAISQLAFKALCPGLSRTGCLLCSQMVASDCAQK